MGRLRKMLAVSFRAKVLVPVILVMICLLGITAWVVNGHITKQFETDARHTLASADESIDYWRRNRNDILGQRVNDLGNEPHFKASITHTDPATVQRVLPELRAAVKGVKIVFFTSNRGELIGSSKSEDDGVELPPAADFAAASSAAVHFALRGGNKVDTIHVGDKLYDIVSISANDAEGNPSGALTFAMEIGHDEAVEISRFTRTEIVLLASNEVIVSTLPEIRRQSPFREHVQGAFRGLIKLRPDAGGHEGHVRRQALLLRRQAV